MEDNGEREKGRMKERGIRRRENERRRRGKLISYQCLEHCVCVCVCVCVSGTLRPELRDSLYSIGERTWAKQCGICSVIARTAQQQASEHFE